jgi:hypothetical protein
MKKDNLISTISNTLSEGRNISRYNNYGEYFSRRLVPMKNGAVLDDVSITVESNADGSGFQTSFDFTGGFSSDYENQFVRSEDLKTPLKGLNSPKDYRPVINQAREDELNKLKKDLISFMDKTNAEFSTLMKKHGYTQQKHT